MLKKTFSLLFLFITPLCFTLGNEITGFWTPLDGKTKKPTSIIALYPYNGQYYGRIIATYNKEGVLDDTLYKPKDRAPGIEGNPYYSGLDILWTTQAENKNKYKGYVVDPTKGKTYNAKLWRKGENLVLRGEMFIFGKNVIWPPFQESFFSDGFPKPDLTTFIPNIPKTAGS